MRVTEECNVIKAEKGFALIELVKKPECGNCKLCAFNKKNAIRVPAKCSIECAPGDRVVVEMPEKPLCGSSLILFAIPLILLLIAVLATANCKWYVQISSIVIALAIGLITVILCDKLVKKNSKRIPTVKKVIKENNIGENQ